MRATRYQKGKDIMEESITINNYRDVIFEENINPIKVLENSVFNLISKTKSVGHYQYDKEKKHFLYREQANIHILKKIDLHDFIFLLEKETESKKKVSQINIEKREGKYYLSYLKNGLKLYFSKYNLDIFDLLVEFYNENVYDTKLKKAS
jgi:hypothetical protein